MEQLGDKFGPFLEFLLRQKVHRVVHLEPIAELYDPKALLDFLALVYHRHRNYLSGYLTQLRNLEDDGKISIEVLKRIYFGSRFHEAYTMLVWKPLK